MIFRKMSINNDERLSRSQHEGVGSLRAHFAVESRIRTRPGETRTLNPTISGLQEDHN